MFISSFRPWLQVVSCDSRPQGWVVVPSFPLKIYLCCLVPEITFKLVPSFLIPKIVYVPLFPKIFCHCFPVPQFKLAVFPSFPKPLGGTLMLNLLFSWCLIAHTYNIPDNPLRNYHTNSYRSFSRDVTAAMLVYKNNRRSLLWVWKAITFLSILYSFDIEVLSCCVVLSLCGEVLSLCDRV